MQRSSQQQSMATASQQQSLATASQNQPHRMSVEQLQQLLVTADLRLQQQLFLGPDEQIYQVIEPDGSVQAGAAPFHQFHFLSISFHLILGPGLSL